VRGTHEARRDGGTAERLGAHCDRVGRHARANMKIKRRERDANARNAQHDAILCAAACEGWGRVIGDSYLYEIPEVMARNTPVGKDWTCCLLMREWARAK
jgi:hypothetical protein